MLFIGGGLGLVAIAVWIFCVVDVITTPENLVRGLPKLAWVFIVLLFMDIGAIAWLIFGRPWTKVPANRPAGRGPAATSRYGGRSATAPRRASNPDDDEEFLASLRKRAEDQRRHTRDDPGNGRGESEPT